MLLAVRRPENRFSLRCGILFLILALLTAVWYGICPPVGSIDVTSPAPPMAAMGEMAGGDQPVTHQCAGDPCPAQASGAYAESTSEDWERLLSVVALGCLLAFVEFVFFLPIKFQPAEPRRRLKKRLSLLYRYCILLN